MADEDIDFSVAETSRSRLSSLFQSENSGATTQALVFTAPKQPKKHDNNQGEAPTMILIHAVVVHAYKLKDGNYALQGKLGCAILGHHETSCYKILLYKGKQMQVTFAAITPNFTFHVQPNNYANFYDEKKENWSVNFDSDVALLDFCKQVILAKANSHGKSLNSLILQDIVCGEGHRLENGDTADVRYTGWLLSNFSFGQMFDSNMKSESSYKVCLGKSKVIKGWHEGLLGMQKGGKRLLVIPSHLAYGAEGLNNVIPPNSILIFEIHVLKVKQSRETSHSPSPNKPKETAPEKKPEVPPHPHINQEDNIRIRGASISEQLTQSPKKDKAQLISRIAKMGTATLPFQGAIPAQVSSDSESEGDAVQSSPPPAPQTASGNSSPKSFTVSRSRHGSGSSMVNQSPQPQTIQAAVPVSVNQQSSQLSLYSQPTVPVQSFVCPTSFSTYQPMPGQYAIPQSPYGIQNFSGVAAPVATSVAESQLPLLITETRNQNTEIRMNLSKLTDKIDMVLQKVDTLSSQQGRAVNSSMPVMENAILLQNIERIILENSRLKEDIESKNSKIQSLNEKILDLFQRNQGFFEESSNMLMERKDSLQVVSVQSQEKILILEEEKSKLQTELSSMTIKFNSLENDLLKYQDLERELQQKLSDAEEEKEKKEKILEENKQLLKEVESLNNLKEKLQNVEEDRDHLIEKIRSMEEHCNKLKESSANAEKCKDEAAKLQLEKYQMELAESVKQRNALELQVQETQKKLDSLQDVNATYEDKIKRLEIESENLNSLKKKFDVFQKKTRLLKEKYEIQIQELMGEIKKLQSAKLDDTPPEFSAEIKKVMNVLYKTLQGNFEANSTYKGTEILQAVLKIIKGLTFQILEKKIQSSDEPKNSAQMLENKPEIPNAKERTFSDLSQQNGESHSEPVKTISKDVLDDSISTTNSNENASIKLKTSESEEMIPKEGNTTSEEKAPILKETVSTEFSQLNIENNSDLAKTSENILDKSNSVIETNKKISQELNEEEIESKEVAEITQEELPISDKEKISPASKSTLKIDIVEERESPEIWRQPPPLDDDDDDDDSDDDWLKSGQY